MPIYTFECYIRKHRYEAIRSLTHSGVESCEECEREGLGFAFAHRVISQTQVHIPNRAIKNKFEQDTVRFAETKTREYEAKHRKVQPLR